MKRCQYCGEQYADNLTTCPKCGAQKKTSAKKTTIIIPILLTVLVLGLWVGNLLLQKSTSITSDYSVGEHVFFGSFEQDGDTANGPEDIEWIVLEVTDSDALLISNSILYYLPYSYNDLEHTWDVSVVRQWLNTEFLNTAFTEDERAQISASEVNNSPYHSTWDKVICLSQGEMVRLFPNDDARIASSTKASGGGTTYWTTTAATEEGQTSQYIIFENGETTWFKSPVFADGVRPAIRLSRDGTVKEADSLGFRVVAAGYYDGLDWENITEICMGSWHALGLKTDGTVVGYAINPDYAGDACQVSDWTNIIGLAAGNGFSVGLKSDGTAVSAGIYSNEYAIDVSSWNNLKSVCAEEGHVVGLRWDGTVVATGWNYYGQCDVNNWTDIYKVAVADDFTVGITFDGHVLSTEPRFDVSSWENICEIGAGGNFVMGREYDGTVHLAYYNEWGEFDVSGWGTTRQIATGYYGALALTPTGKVLGEGISTITDSNGFLTVSDDVNPAFITDDWTNIIQISTNGFLSVGLRATGTIEYAFGSDYPDSWGDTIAFWTSIRKVYAGNGGVIGLQYNS